MKKYVFVFSFIACTFFVASLHAQSYKKNDFHISVGYGIGNIWKGFLKDAFSYPLEYSVKSTGPFCLLMDYGLLKKISVGVAVGYSQTRGSSDFRGFVFDEQLNAFSILARANYHPFHFDKWDPYGGVGMGYYHFKYISKQSSSESGKVPGNLGYSIQLGTRYYIFPKLALYTEIGYLGGSLLQLGAAIKW